MRILIVDAQQDRGAQLEQLLATMGYDCLLAHDGPDGWQRFLDSAVDVILSAWHLPTLDGLDLCRRVREHPSATYTYFLFLISAGEREHLPAGIAAGADGFLSSPVDAHELRGAMLSAERVLGVQARLRQQQAELEQLQRDLARQARRDPLTLLPNRLQFREDIGTIHARIERYQHHYCAVLCDLDDFKRYNDHYGQLRGDTVLQVVAKALVQNVRTGDTVYRYGGEEFLLILPEQSLKTAVIASERIRQRIEQLAIPHKGKTPPGVITLSAGVAMLRADDNQSTQKWLHQTELALENAKRNGRNRVEVYQ